MKIIFSYDLQKPYDVSDYVNVDETVKQMYPTAVKPLQSVYIIHDDSLLLAVSKLQTSLRQQDKYIIASINGEITYSANIPIEDKDASDEMSSAMMTYFGINK